MNELQSEVTLSHRVDDGVRRNPLQLLRLPLLVLHTQVGCLTWCVTPMLCFASAFCAFVPRETIKTARNNYCAISTFLHLYMSPVPSPELGLRMNISTFRHVYIPTGSAFSTILHFYICKFLLSLYVKISKCLHYYIFHIIYTSALQYFRIIIFSDIFNISTCLRFYVYSCIHGPSVLHVYVSTFLHFYVYTSLHFPMFDIFYASTFAPCLLFYIFCTFYVSTFLHVHVSTFLHFYISTWQHFYISAFQHFYITTFLYFYTYASLHFDISTFLHVYISEFLHVYMSAFLQPFYACVQFNKSTFPHFYISAVRHN